MREIKKSKHFLVKWKENRNIDIQNTLKKVIKIRNTDEIKIERNVGIKTGS